jgi:hypothetical protein
MYKSILTARFGAFAAKYKVEQVRQTKDVEQKLN